MADMTLSEYYTAGYKTISDAAIAKYNTFLTVDNASSIEHIIKHKFGTRFLFDDAQTQDDMQQLVLDMLADNSYRFGKIYATMQLQYDPLKNINLTRQYTDVKANTGTQVMAGSNDESGTDTRSIQDSGTEQHDNTESGTDTVENVDSGTENHVDTESGSDSKTSIESGSEVHGDQTSGTDTTTRTPELTSTDSKNTYDQATMEEIVKTASTGTETNSTTYGKLDSMTITFGKHIQDTMTYGKVDTNVITFGKHVQQTTNYGKIDTDIITFGKKVTDATNYGHKVTTGNTRTDDLNENLNHNETETGYNGIDIQAIIEKERKIAELQFLTLIAEDIANYVSYTVYF